MIPIDCHVIQQSKIYQIITLSILLTDGLINAYHFRWNKCLSTMIIETTYTIINQLPFKLGVFHMSRTHFWLFTPNHPLLQMIKPIPRHSGLSQYKKISLRLQNPNFDNKIKLPKKFKISPVVASFILCLLSIIFVNKVH